MSYLTQFLESVRDKNFVILDTETTGLDSDDEICQIAIINSKGETLLDSLVKPNVLVSPKASEIHGITNDMLEHAADWKTLFPEIRSHIENNIIVIYNADFDLRMLHQTCLAHNSETMDWFELDSYCAMEAFAEFYGDWSSWHGSYRWKPLTTAVSYLGLEVANAHDALGDSLVTLAVVQELLKRGGQS